MKLIRLVQVGNSSSDKHSAGLIVAVSFVLVFSLAASGQTQKQCTARPDVAVAQDKAGVYITYERAGEFKSVPGRLGAADPSDEEKLRGRSIQGVWLRLNNNTHWAISVPTDSLYVGPKTTPLKLCDGSGALGLRDGIEVSARYEVEVLSGHEGVNKPKVANRIDFSSSAWLRPGGSVLFVVPRDYLKDFLAIYFPFNYEWEMESGRMRSDEPEHRVYFRSWNLPKHLR